MSKASEGNSKNKKLAVGRKKLPTDLNILLMLRITQANNGKPFMLTLAAQISAR